MLKHWVVTARLFFIGSTVAIFAGCATQIKMPDASKVANLDPMKSWSEVLKESVDADGSVDFHNLDRDPRKLEAYVHFVATNGPKLTPEKFSTPELRLAHYINAYNALSMYTVLAKKIPETNAGFKKVSFFYLQKLVVDGERMSLAGFENDIIRKLGEPRIHFALNCMAVSCPRLPRIPFTAETLDSQLEQETKFFFSEERNLRIDPASKTVFTTEILDFFPEDFLAKSPTLQDYISQYAPKPIPADYKIKFIDYDWTINSQNRKK